MSDIPLIKVTKDDFIFKILVKGGLIASNQEAKRLIKEGAIALCEPGSFKKDGYKITLDDKMDLLFEAAIRGYYIKIGKLFIEKLSIEGYNDN